MNTHDHWGPCPFTVLNKGAGPVGIIVQGRERWALERLIAAGEWGCTPLDTPAPRCSAYIHDLRGMGLAIVTVHEPHGGPFAGHHGRYVPCSAVARKGGAA